MKSMNEHIKHHDQAPQSSSDRSFGLVFAAFFLIIALIPLLHGNGARLWAIGLSLICGVIALVIPNILAPLNRIWTRLGLLMHRIVNPIALGIIFFGVVTPIGLLMRLFDKDPLRLRLDKAATSYWIVRTPPGPAPDSFINQF